MAELKLGDEIIANIDDLREHYSFSDILTHFKSGELVAWCEKNGYSDESNAIKSLPKDLREAQIHLKLCKIFIGADKTPRWILQWFGEYYDEWAKKTDELSALLDKALLLCEVFEKNNYVISKAEEKEIESLSGKINKVADKVDEIYRSYCGYSSKVSEDYETYIPNIQWSNKYIIRKLDILYVNRYEASEAKKERLYKMPISKFFKKDKS